MADMKLSDIADILKRMDSKLGKQSKERDRADSSIRERPGNLQVPNISNSLRQLASGNLQGLSNVVLDLSKLFVNLATAVRPVAKSNLVPDLLSKTLGSLTGDLIGSKFIGRSVATATSKSLRDVITINMDKVMEMGFLHDKAHTAFSKLISPDIAGAMSKFGSRPDVAGGMSKFGAGSPLDLIGGMSAFGGKAGMPLGPAPWWAAVTHGGSSPMAKKLMKEKKPWWAQVTHGGNSAAAEKLMAGATSPWNAGNRTGSSGVSGMLPSITGSLSSVLGGVGTVASSVAGAFGTTITEVIAGLSGLTVGTIAAVAAVVAIPPALAALGIGIFEAERAFAEASGPMAGLFAKWDVFLFNFMGRVGNKVAPSAQFLEASLEKLLTRIEPYLDTAISTLNYILGGITYAIEWLIQLFEVLNPLSTAALGWLRSLVTSGGTVTDDAATQIFYQQALYNERLRNGTIGRGPAGSFAP